MRALNSYAKVQALVGTLIRNSRFQLRSTRVRTLRYLDVGCGPNTNVGLINLDYFWSPQVDLCWDISRGLPFADRSLLGVFSEHCLEHFHLPEGMRLLREIRRVLAPGGTLRLVVPDAELYLRTYVRQMDGESNLQNPFQYLDAATPPWTPLRTVDRVFYMDRKSPFGHCTMFDFQLLATVLADCGFAGIIRQEFRRGRDPVLLVDASHRQIESLYVEAVAE